MNLFHAVKLVCSKTLMHCPISGNMHLAKNGMIMNYQTVAPEVDQEALNASQFAYHQEEVLSVSAGNQTAQKMRKARNPYGDIEDEEESKEELHASAGPLSLSQLGATQNSQLNSDIRQRVKQLGYH